MNEIKTKVINLFSGPGAGKSTTATAVFALLKMHDINAEYVSEYAKDKAWEKTLGVYYNQIKILGEQHNRQYRLVGQADVIITDSPILQQAAYVEDPWYFDVCKHLFDQFDNTNYFIERVKKFNPKGRKHNLEEAKVIDEKIWHVLHDNKYRFSSIKGDINAANIIVNHILAELDIRHDYGIADITGNELE